jgi:GTP-binding protein Era
MTEHHPHRAGFCAILGLPNVGKSTLLNSVLGMKLVAVSPKPQTTRNRIAGVKNLAHAQLVFVDTPGIQQGHNALRRYMRDEALLAAGECDVALLLLDAADPRQRSPEALAAGDAAELGTALAGLAAPAVLGLNKVDRLKDKRLLLPMMEAFAASQRFAEIVPISATTGSGLDRLVEVIAGLLPEGPALFPEEMVTDRAERFLAAEFVREQLFLQLGAELPYASAVVVEEFAERRDRGDLFIRAAVFVERESQKSIVVGKGGSRIKEVGQRARAVIAEFLGCPVHLKLFVKVDPGWSEKQPGIKRMGYE